MGARTFPSTDSAPHREGEECVQNPVSAAEDLPTPTTIRQQGFSMIKTFLVSTVPIESYLNVKNTQLE